MKAYLASLFLVASLTGCFAASPHGDDDDGTGGACLGSTIPSYTIDTGATITHEAGVDPGYYAECEGSGAWHFEWTCDTDLSAQGCTFSGSILAPTPASGDVNATCYECESDDQLSTQPDGENTEIDFNTNTSTGIDGVDFVTNAGSAIQIDFYVNGIYQNDLVFLPSNSAAVNPSCMPAQLVPSTP